MPSSYVSKLIVFLSLLHHPTMREAGATFTATASNGAEQGGKWVLPDREKLVSSLNGRSFK